MKAHWTIWVPIVFTAIGGVVVLMLLIGSKADASDVASHAARIERIEVHLQYLVKAVYTIAQSQGLNVPPPPDL